jgi:hypothetical protein
MALIKASRDGACTALSITASSAALMPMWRAMNSDAFSNALRLELCGMVI